MKKKSAKASGLSQEEILAAAERTRLACNQLTREERRRLMEEGLRIISGGDATS